MNPPALLMPGRTRLVLFLGFVSGCSALIQEIVWIRWFALILGQGPQAMAIVLAIQMFGIGLGTLVARRWTAGMDFMTAIRAYGVVEMAVGTVGLATAFVLPHGGQILSVLPVGMPLWGHDVCHVMFAVFMLLLPTTLIGVTFPVALAALKSAGNPCVPKIYGANVLGAAFGSTTTGYLLIPALGMRGTFFLSLILNFMLAGVLLRGKVEIPWPQNRSQPSHGSKEGDGGVLLGLFFLGVGGMAAEVVWTRGLLIVLGSTTYTVSLVIGLFLAGMGLGSWVYSKGGNALSSGSIPAAVGCFIIAVGVFLSIPLLSRIPVAYSYAQILFGSHPVGRSLIRMVCAAAILLIPTIGMGAVFPWWMQRAKHCTTEQGYAVLCFGNAAGCLMAGFVLLPFLEIKNGLMVISGLYALAGGIDLYAGSRYRWIPIVFLGTGFLVVGSATPAVWDKKIFSSGAFLYAPTTDGWKGVRNFWTSVRAYQLSFAKDGPTSTVTVWKSPEGPPFLRINGKTDASIGRDMDTQILSATLPLLLNGGVEQQALVIGFGSGITSGLLAEDPRCASVTVVEIEPAVLEAGDCFSKENRHVLRNKKLKQVVMDARGWLLKDHRRYDVITAEPSNLWIGGMAHLYTREAFRLYRERLTGSGVFCQWIQGYGISEDDFRRVMATFNDVFPHVALVSARNGDFFMVGSPRPWGDPEHSFAPSRGATVNIPLGLGKKAAPVVPTALWVLDEAAFRYSSQGYGIHTDDRPFLEFSTPAQMGKDASVEIQNNLILESAGLRLQ